MLSLPQIAKTDPILFPTLLKSIEDNRVFRKLEYRESFSKNINNLLNLRESRHNALLLLNLFCDHHSVVNTPIITEKTSQEINWIEQLLKIIEQETQNHSSECFEILGKLLRITSYNPDTNKIVQSKYVQKIVEAIVMSQASPKQSLDCLSTCLEIHAGTTGIYKNKIFAYCVSFIDVPDNEIAEKVANCLHLLQQSRGGSVAGGVYHKAWKEFHEKILGNIVITMDKFLYKGGCRTTEVNTPHYKLPSLNFRSEPFSGNFQLLVRFNNLIAILCVSLQRSFPTSKEIRVSQVLELIEARTSMTQDSLEKKAFSDAMALSLVIGQTHINVLNVLITIMNTLGQNIVTHSKSICDILWRCLKQTNSQEQLKFEVNLRVRALTYEAFIVFMRISPNNFFLKAAMENLMKEALIDVTPANNEIYLMMPQQSDRKSNKAKKIESNKFSKGRTHIANIIDEQEVCVKALECLGFLLVYHGALMKPVLFYALQEKIISIGFLISSKVLLDGDLYRDPKCRARLTDLVGFLMIYPVNKMPVPINYGIALLTKIKHSDPSLAVRDCAAMNLYRAETAIHNRKDVFYYPPDYKDFRDTLLFNKQTIQKLLELKPNSSVHHEQEANGKHADTLEMKDIEEETENIIVSDNESDQNITVVEKQEDKRMESPKKDQTEVNETSDDEKNAQEISDEESVSKTAPRVEIPMLTRSAGKKKFAAAVDNKVEPKKRKVSDKKSEGDEVDKLLADFNG